MLVDDDQPFADMISDLLTEEFGCGVLVCTNADQAEPMVLAVRADVVLLDMVMPGGGGREALRALKTNPLTRPVPVIVCTAATLVDRDRDELLALGAAVILAKPFDIDDLIALVGEHIPSCQASRPLIAAAARSACDPHVDARAITDGTLYVASVGDARRMGKFWNRASEWCRGSAMLGTSSLGARQPCPVCGKVVRVHTTGRINAHLPAKTAAK